MHCERAQALISPYLDGELSAGERRAVEAHIGQCAACAELAADYRHMGQKIADFGREPASRTLLSRVQASLSEAAGADERHRETAMRAWEPRRIWELVRPYLREAAAIAAACIVTAFATWWVVAAEQRTALVERDVIAAHVRSLLQDSPIQVASSDAHTVKPWFAGRVDFSPDVKDLTAEGFPLVGGRIDYVNGRRVSAVVYKRRLHTINVFSWPSSSAEESSPRLMVHDGFNILSWSRRGIEYWAVSDVNPADLRQLQSLL